MNPLETALEAESMRRRHCSSQGEPDHQCIGKITIAPGLCILDCKKCGTEHINTIEAMSILDERKKANSELIDQELLDA